jgi:hypothetical protein
VAHPLHEALDRLASCEVLTGGEWEALSDGNPVVARFRQTNGERTYGCSLPSTTTARVAPQ